MNKRFLNHLATIALFSFFFVLFSTQVRAQQCMSQDPNGCPDGYYCDCDGTPGCGEDNVRGVCQPIKQENGSPCTANNQCTSGLCDLGNTNTCISTNSLPGCSSGWTFDTQDTNMSACLQGGLLKFECRSGFAFDPNTNLCKPVNPTAVPSGTSQNAPTPTTSVCFPKIGNNSCGGANPVECAWGPVPLCCPNQNACSVLQVTPAPGDGDSQVVNSEFLYKVNPLTITGDNLVGQIFGFFNEKRFASPSGILNRALTVFLFPLAGLILFIMIVWGGFEMLYGASDTKAQEAGKQRITAALIGFLLLFLSYWIAQIIQAIFGVNVLG